MGTLPSDGPLSGENHSPPPPQAEWAGFGSGGASPEPTFTPHRKRSRLIDAAAGLHAGIIGVFWMFACFVIAAVLTGGGIWSAPNLFSTLFYGSRAVDDEFSRYTWAGIALIVFIYGILGALWGLCWREKRRPVLSFVGALAGIAVYYLFFRLIWTHADPLIPLYASVPEMQLAHILWGAWLARSPRYAARIAEASESGNAHSDAAGNVSGEVIR